MSRPASLRAQLESRLQELAAAGLDGLPREAEHDELRARRPKPGQRRTGRREPAPPPAPARAPAAAASAPPAPAERGAAAAGAEAAKDWRGMGLAELGAHLGSCTLCRLSEGRTQVVFGVGDPDARLMFVGEGPGAEEDRRGEPFVGKAGELLTDMIEKGMKLRRAEVYIANVVKCRPPGNRDPQPDEVEACEGFLKRQVELVAPEVIVALGRFAVQCLLKSRSPIGRLRGTWHEYQGIPLMPTFHPAYLLRSPEKKREAWQDLQEVMARLGLTNERG